MSFCDFINQENEKLAKKVRQKTRLFGKSRLREEIENNETLKRSLLEVAFEGTLCDSEEKTLL